MFANGSADRNATEFNVGGLPRSKLDEFNEICNRLKKTPVALPKLFIYKVQRNEDDHICCADVQKNLSHYAVGMNSSEISVFPIDQRALFNLDREVSSSSHVRKFVLDREQRSSNQQRDAQMNAINERLLEQQPRPISLIGHSDRVVEVRFLNDCQRLLSCSADCLVKLWNIGGQEESQGLNQNRLCSSFDAHLQPIWTLDVNALDSHFATGSRDHSARLFALDRKEVLRVFSGHTGPVNTVRFHSNCKYLASGASDRTVRMWDVNNGNLVRVFTGHRQEIYSLAFSPSGKFIASSGEDCSIMIWDISAGKLICQVPQTPHTLSINSLQFSSDGNLLVSSSIDKLVCVWNLQSLQDSNFRLECLLSKDTGIQLRRTAFTHPDLLIGVGT